MVDCLRCGIARASPGGACECFKFKKPVNTQGSTLDGECSYFIEMVFEDGEPWTPMQHLLIKEQELAARKLKGPLG